MAIGKRPGGIELPKVNPDGVVDQPNIVHHPDRRNEVDLEKLPYTRLLQHAEGFRWVVDVYRQLSGRDNINTEFDPFTDDPSQQYALIKDYQIRLPSGITPSQDVSEKVFKITGEVFDDFGLQLNENDLFVAYTGNGDRVAFNITESERLSTLKDASYRLGFEARHILSDSDIESLNSKVVDNKVFSMDWLERTGDAIIDGDFNSKVKSLKKKGKLLLDLYHRRFYFSAARSLRIPEQTSDTYDPFLTSLVKYISDHEYLEYSMPPFDLDRVDTLFSLLLKPREELLPFLIKDFGLVDEKPFYQKRAYSSFCHSQYRYAVWSGDIEQDYIAHPITTELGRGTTEPFVERLDSKGVPYFKKMTLTPYVLTEGFYSGTGESVLEIELLRYLRGENISLEVVFKLIDECLLLPPVETFYYLPLVVVLVYYVSE